MGVNASDVRTTCYHHCNQTFESRHQCYKRCQELAPNDGYKVYGWPYSTNTRRVLAVLHEKGLSYDPVTVDLKAESRAISEYIANVHQSKGSQLLNYESYKTMGTQRMWMYIESLDFDPLASILAFEQYIKPTYGLRTISFTLADLYHLPNIQYLMDTKTKRLFESRASVHRWVAEITARPAWKKACDVKAWYGKKKN
ncbi:hypothetical protein CARUB_v10012405mg [Capsella rubella]|uniref:glutathione transferase n=1 Tax=Capsella rubella TaxID=81985 RepID=R0IA91_9BRAS|nr:hypothetical protein CARUB_v10012405mg [Capsella rubella]